MASVLQRVECEMLIFIFKSLQKHALSFSQFQSQSQPNRTPHIPIISEPTYTHLFLFYYQPKPSAIAFILWRSIRKDHQIIGAPQACPTNQYDHGRSVLHSPQFPNHSKMCQFKKIKCPYNQPFTILQGGWSHRFASLFKMIDCMTAGSITVYTNLVWRERMETRVSAHRVRANQ